MSIRDIKKKAAMQGDSRIVELYNRFLIDREKGDDSHRDGHIHPSMLGGCRVCAAFAVLDFKPPFSGTDPKLLRIFDLGTAIHVILQRDFAQMGLFELHPDGSPKSELSISIPELDVVGHADGVINKEVYGHRAILEIKSINTNAFGRLQEPKPEHKIQAGCYALAEDIEYVLFVYYSKNDSDLKCFFYKVKPADIQEVKVRCADITKLVKDFREHGKFPQPCHELKTGSPCKYCVWQRVCHSTFDREAFIKSASKENQDAQAPKARKEKRSGPVPPKRKLPRPGR